MRGPYRPNDEERYPQGYQQPPQQNLGYLQRPPIEQRKIPDGLQNRKIQQDSPQGYNQRDQYNKPPGQYDRPERQQPFYNDQQPNGPRGFERPPPGFYPQFPGDRYNQPPYDPISFGDQMYRPISAPYAKQQHPYLQQSPSGLRQQQLPYRGGPSLDFRDPQLDYRQIPQQDYRQLADQRYPPQQYVGIPPPDPRDYRAPKYRDQDPYHDYKGYLPPPINRIPPSGNNIPQEYRQYPNAYGDKKQYQPPPPEFRAPPYARQEYSRTINQPERLPPQIGEYRRGIPDYQGDYRRPQDYRQGPPLDYRDQGPPQDYRPQGPRMNSRDGQINRGGIPQEPYQRLDQVYRGGPGGRDYEPRRPLSPQNQRAPYPDYNSPQMQRIKQV